MQMQSFLEAVERKIIQRKDRVEPTELFPDEERKIPLIGTGYGFQEFIREELDWYFIRNYKGLISLVSTTTEFKLHLSGAEGEMNGSTIMNQIAKSFSTPDFGFVTHPIYDDDITQMQNTGAQDILDKLKFPAWLGSPGPQNGLYYVTFGGYERERCMTGLGGDAFYYAYGLSFIGQIKTPNIIVDLDSMSKYGYWKLYRKEK